MQRGSNCRMGGHAAGGDVEHVHSSTIQIEIGTTDSYIFPLLSDIFLISFPFLPSSPRINRRDMSLNYFKYAVEISVRVVGGALSE